MKSLVGAMVVISLTVAQTPAASAEGGDVEVTGEVALASTYVWRGINYHDDRFEPAAQPYAQATWRELTVGVWASIPFAEQSETAAEYDPYVIYARDVGPVSVELLYWLFLQPAYDPVDTGHLAQVKATYRFASLGASVDPVREGGAYYFASLAAEGTTGKITVSRGVNLGLSHGGGQDFGVQDATLFAGVSYETSARSYASATATFVYGPRMPAGARLIPALVVAIGYTR